MLSRGVDPAAAYPAITVTRAVFDAAPTDPERLAVLDARSGRSITYAELSRLVGLAASNLVRKGIAPGDVVGVDLADAPELAIAVHAVIAAGGAPFPVAGDPAAASLLDAAGARATITGRPGNAPRSLDLTDLLGPDHGPATDPAAAREAGRPAGPPPSAPTTPRRDAAMGAEGGARERDAAPARDSAATVAGRGVGGGVGEAGGDPDRDVALVACTRGSARGGGRTVRLTHAEVVAGLVRVADSAMFGGADIVLSALPLTGVLGLNGVLNPALRLGATVVVLSGAGRHDLLRALQDHRVTVAVLPPELVEALGCDRAVSRHDLRALRAVVVAGGPLAAEEARAAATRLGCPVRQAYGLAEAAGFTHLNLRAAEEGTLDSVGRGLPGVTWRVVDPRGGAAQPSYQPGELCVRLPVARTAAVPVRWLPTGDSAFADDHDRVFILGRLPASPPEPPGEPEMVLAAHPSVGDVAVAPAPDDDLGLTPHAFVVLTGPASEPELLAYVNGHVAKTREVSAVHIVDEIPRTSGGRVRRRALLERAGLGA